MESENPIADSHRKVNPESPETDESLQAGAFPRIGGFSSRQLLKFIVVNAIGINLLLVLAGGLLFHTFQQPSALRGVVASLLFHQADDSLRPMLYAVHSFENNPKAPIYQSIFFEQHVKFQYPLSSLLPILGMEHLGFGYGVLRWTSKIVCWLCTLVTLWLCVRIAMRLSRTDAQVPQARRNTLYQILAVGGGGLFFYPLIRGNWLGQAQTVITLLFTLAFYAWLQGNEIWSGVAMGLTVLIKPQYGLLLFWTLIRKKYSAFLSGTICVAIGTLASIAVFGWHQNLGYVSLLQFLSKHGESYSANQSMNGVLNRLLMNGNNLQWSNTDFPPYRPLVYYGTVLSSLLLLAAALFLPWSRVRKGSVADLACFSLAVTMASPVAWEHHYAILLPMLIWLWFADYGQRDKGRWGLVFAVIWVVSADYLSPADLFAPVPGLNILQSTLYLAALAVLVLLMKSDSQLARQAESAAW